MRARSARCVDALPPSEPDFAFSVEGKQMEKLAGWARPLSASP